VPFFLVSSSPLTVTPHSSDMSEKTSNVLVTPEPGTKVSPIHEYTEEQATKIKALREARHVPTPS